MRTSARALLALLALLGTACAGSSNGAPPTTTSSSSSTTPTTVAQQTGSVELGGPERPAMLVAPDEVTAPAPLLVLLHGYSANAGFEDSYLGVTEQAASRGLYVLLPNGTPDTLGRPFWDATPACCNSTGVPVDDVGYLAGLIDEAIAARPIDPGRIYVLGHSNGGFMAYRLACERADLITAVAVLAGSDDGSAAACTPSRAVSVLHLHGTADDIVPYAGGRIPSSVGDFPGTFPGALEVVRRWGVRDQCGEPAVGVTSPLDLDDAVPGAETFGARYEGCADGTVVQLDTITGGGHLPALSHAKVGAEVLDWLLARQR